MTRRALEQLALKLGFPPGRWSDGEDGLRALFEGEHLQRLEWIHEGKGAGWIHLTLDPERKKGTLTWPQGSGGTADMECYGDGAWERFDAWSDNTSPQAMGWSAWTHRAASQVLGVVGCLLCGERLHGAKAGAHTADGLNFLCVPCWRSLSTWAPTRRSWPLGARRCRGCGRDCPDDEPLFEGRAGKVCVPCHGALKPVKRGWWS